MRHRRATKRDAGPLAAAPTTIGHDVNHDVDGVGTVGTAAADDESSATAAVAAVADSACPTPAMHQEAPAGGISHVAPSAAPPGEEAAAAGLTDRLVVAVIGVLGLGATIWALLYMRCVRFWMGSTLACAAGCVAGLPAAHLWDNFGCGCVVRFSLCGLCVSDSAARHGAQMASRADGALGAGAPRTSLTATVGIINRDCSCRP